jgi:phosphohistidine phosphatase
VSTSLLADDPGSALLREIAGRRVALVGHEPWMGELAAWLLHSDREAGSSFVIKKGGVVWLEGNPSPGQMTLRGFFPPKALRAMSRLDDSDESND